MKYILKGLYWFGIAAGSLFIMAILAATVYFGMYLGSLIGRNLGKGL